MSKYKVGDTVLVVSTGYRNNSKSADATLTDGVVVKVGRKWMTVEYGDRWKSAEVFDASTGVVKTEYAPRVFVYQSREAYEAKIRVEKAWDAFRSAMSHRYTRPSHLTAETLEAWTAELTRGHA